MDKQNHPSDSGKATQSPHPDHSGALQKSAGFDKVGDKSGNHAWNKMTGAGAHQCDQVLGPGPHDKDSVHMGGHGGVSPIVGFRNRNVTWNDDGSSPTIGDKNRDEQPTAGALDTNGSRHIAANDNGSELTAQAGDQYNSARTTHNDSSRVAGTDGTAAHAAGDQSQRVTESGQNDQRAINEGLSARSMAALYGKPVGNSDNASMARSSDGGTDRPTEALALQKATPELPMFTKEDLLHAPISDLRKVANDARKSLEEYVGKNKESIPTFTLHGTTRDGAQQLQAEKPSKYDLYTAGQEPSRRSLGDKQHLADVSAGFTYANDYTKKRATANNPAGPIMIYDVGHQPETFYKNEEGNKGAVDLGQSNDHDFAKFAVLDPSQAKLIGSIPREQLDGMKDKFKPLYSALDEKQHQILSSPGGIDAEAAKDLQSRVEILANLNRTYELKTTLDAVARSRNSNLM